MTPINVNGIVGEDGPGGLLDIAHPVVVSQSFPGTKEFGLGRSGKSLEVGKSLQKAFKAPILDHGRHRGLLEHDFRDQDGVRVRGLPPGIVGWALVKPAQKRVAQGADVFQGVASGGRLEHRAKIGHCREEVDHGKFPRWQ